MSEWKECPKCNCMNLRRDNCVDCGLSLVAVEFESDRVDHHAEEMQTMRHEFACAWPAIWKRISESDRKATHDLCKHVAWMTWKAAKGINQSNQPKEDQ